LNTNNLKDALKNIESIRSIRASHVLTENIDGYDIVKSIEGHGYQIRSFVFAFNSNTGIINIGTYLIENKYNINGIFILTQGMLLYTRPMVTKKGISPNGKLIEIEKKDGLDKLTAIFGKNSEVGSFVLLNLLDFMVNHIEEINNETRNKKSKLSQYYKIKYQYVMQEIEQSSKNDA
jgi:hypothetical protein